MIYLDPRFWLAIVLAAGIGTVGGCVKGAKDERNTAEIEHARKVAEAVDVERELQAVANGWTSDYINRLTKQNEAARALPRITLVNDCAVPAAVGRVLNDAQSLYPDAGSGPSTGPASAEVDSTCAAELEIAKRNYADVCTPNAEQLTELQERWRRTAEAVNGR